MTLWASVASMFCSLSLGAAPAPTVAVAVVPAECVCKFVVLNPAIESSAVVDVDAQVSPDLGDEVGEVDDSSEASEEREVSPDKVVLVTADDLLPADVVSDEPELLPADVVIEDEEALLPADVYLDAELAEALLPADVIIDSEDENLLPADVFTDIEIEIESALAALPTPPLFADTGAEFERLSEVEEEVSEPDSPAAAEESEESAEIEDDSADGEAAS